MTLSILGFAGTSELRETMILSLPDKLPSKRWSGGALIFMLCGMFSSAAWAFQLGNPTGIQQIGKQLDLSISVSEIPPGTESQLRSTCLKARAKSNGKQGAAAFEARLAEEVQVEFVPTIRQGGLIHFKSRLPINDALVELELVSDCPLLSFKNSWMLIMEAEQNTSMSSGQSVSGLPPVSAGFDLGNSSLLKASRLVPKRAGMVSTGFKPEVKEKTIVAKNETPAPKSAAEGTGIVRVDPRADLLVEPPEFDSPVAEPVRLAALDQELSSQGLIESRPSVQPERPDLSSGNKTIWMGFDLSSPAIYVFVVSIAMLLFLSIAFGKSQWKRLRASKTGAEKLEPGSMSSTVAFSAHAGDREEGEQILAPTTNDSSACGPDRVLESLMGAGGQNPETASEELKALINSEHTESHYRTSLSICLELVNKADIRAWNLPDTYNTLVAARNKSLDLHRTADALLLRSQVGLVELAFQEARKGKRLPDDVALDLLQLMTGDHKFDLESKPSLCVPDVVKSHVRAKMCEIAGAEKRQLLQENLVNLNVQITNPGLCFSSNAWREFLSEEGMLE